MPGMVFRVFDVNNSIHREKLRLDKSAALTRDMKPVFERVSLDMLRIENLVFRSQGRRGGGSWKRLTPGTLRQKGMYQIFYTKYALPTYNKPGFGNDTLVNSLTKLGARYQIRHVDKEGLYFGTSRPFAKLHQEGSLNLPARPFIRFLPEDWARWAEWVGEWTVRPFETPL